MKMQLNINGIKTIITLSKSELIKKIIHSVDIFGNDSSVYCKFDILNQTNEFVDKQKLYYFLNEKNWNTSFYLEKDKENLELTVIAKD